jgi:methyl-accepting chemotaxis protein
MQHGIPDWIYITFTAVTAVGVLMQALVLLGMLFALKGALGRVNEISKKAEEHALPLLQSTRALLEEVSPKLKVAAQNALEVSQTAKEVSQTVKAESTRVAASVDDLMKKASVQVDRVDEMVTGTLNSVAHATASVQKAVSGPVRQVSAVLNGLRAGLGALRHKEHEVDVAADSDQFV